MSGRTLSVRALVKRHGHGHDFELDVRLDIPPGITCVLGPSGAGKSTLLGVVSGLVHPDEGRISLGDAVWLDTARGIDVPVDRRRVAYVFQSLALFPHLDAIHNVEYGMARALPRPERHARAEKLLSRLGVSHLSRRRPRTFSGGEAQRVALARALAMEPQAILLDEPFSALDRDLRVQLASLVRDLVDELGVPLLHVTHSTGEARALADRVVHVERGRVVAEGSPDHVLGRRDDEDDAPDPGGTPMPELIRR